MFSVYRLNINWVSLQNKVLQQFFHLYFKPNYFTQILSFIPKLFTFLNNPKFCEKPYLKLLNSKRVRVSIYNILCYDLRDYILDRVKYNFFCFDQNSWVQNWWIIVWRAHNQNLNLKFKVLWLFWSIKWSKVFIVLYEK